MICQQCKTPVSAGDKCPSCGQRLALLTPPPAEFNKKGELYVKTLELRAGQMDATGFAQYVHGELAKIVAAREKLREGEARVLVEGLDFWQQSLERAQQWLVSLSDFDLQAALNLATRADECINRSIQDQFEQNTEMVRTFQADARLRENPLPDIPDDGLLVGFELRNKPK